VLTNNKQKTASAPNNVIQARRCGLEPIVPRQ
jgi:hypothetical protein